MAITILRTLNRPAPVEQMTKHFEAKDHFRTNSFERNPSFSVNCNILTSLLSAEQCLGDNATQIEKALRFLCDTWWNSDLRIKDKWVILDRNLTTGGLKLTSDRTSALTIPKCSFLSL